MPYDQLVEQLWQLSWWESFNMAAKTDFIFMVKTWPLYVVIFIVYPIYAFWPTKKKG